MDWQDEGIVLSASKLGESDAVLEVLTPNYGRHRGFVKGGSGKRGRANLQAGNKLALTWRSRIEGNLGRFTVELVHSPLGSLMGDGFRLSALSAIVSVISASLPEREPHSGVYEVLEILIKLLEDSDDPQYLASGLARLELGILSELGYGLDLSKCAATGSPDDLVYVSPKTGRAVSREAGKPYHDKLLPLPEFMLASQAPVDGNEDVINGLTLTGFFMERHVWGQAKNGQPAARERFLSTVRRRAEAD
ncbi:DNA repair protein RecO [Kordiimonas sp. SCSIO 12610]|uniref:DNA repair protein RecO n=1 Tax=Kordiimonas sp. SCSIO 12610 TaxID=2829597 RepID=UPI002109DBE7|nr:DNA repair protein RecO [Kordiimonas sp. SCSIO 12610]UTW56671.1 DNA repair protein RecO [Kordiimonas sp. SCSIO 12610]